MPPTLKTGQLNNAVGSYIPEAKEKTDVRNVWSLTTDWFYSLYDSDAKEAINEALKTYTHVTLQLSPVGVLVIHAEDDTGNTHLLAIMPDVRTQKAISATIQEQQDEDEEEKVVDKLEGMVYGEHDDRDEQIEALHGVEEAEKEFLKKEKMAFMYGRSSKLPAEYAKGAKPEMTLHHSLALITKFKDSVINQQEAKTLLNLVMSEGNGADKLFDTLIARPDVQTAVRGSKPALKRLLVTGLSATLMGKYEKARDVPRPIAHGTLGSKLDEVAQQKIADLKNEEEQNASHTLHEDMASKKETLQATDKKRVIENATSVGSIKGVDVFPAGASAEKVLQIHSDLLIEAYVRKISFAGTLTWPNPRSYMIHMPGGSYGVHKDDAPESCECQEGQQRCVCPMPFASALMKRGERHEIPKNGSLTIVGHHPSSSLTDVDSQSYQNGGHLVQSYPSTTVNTVNLCTITTNSSAGGKVMFNVDSIHPASSQWSTPPSSASA